MLGVALGKGDGDDYGLSRDGQVGMKPKYTFIAVVSKNGGGSVHQEL